MKTVRIVMIAALAASASAVLAGPYDQPYVLFEADRRSAVQDTAPATVVKIDGEDVRRGREEPRAPGKHSVEVSIPGPKGMSNPGRDTVEIDAKPCTRYLLAAKRSARTAKDWDAFVAAEEPIGECRRKFMKEGGK